MVIATLAELTKTYPSVVVLDRVNASIQNGEKIGLVGPNGCGKTTLLEILAGLVEIESGEASLARGTSIGYLPQTPETGDLDCSLIDYLRSAHGRIIETRKRLEELENRLASGQATPAEIEQYSKNLDWLDRSGGFSLETMLEKTAIGLGLEKELHRRRLSQLSGGQLNRAALARLLSSKPDLMLLDEPTNHLDIDGIKFLEDYLDATPAAALIVSHDRRFLDNVCRTIWELRRGRLKIFKGNFSAYLEKRRQDDALALKAYIRQKEFIAKTEAFIRKNIAGQKTNQAKSRRKMLARLEKKDKPSAPEKSIRLSFAGAERSERIICVMENLSFGYSDKPILKDINLTIERGQRIGLLGKNGSGKTTLLRIMVEELSPAEGNFYRAKNLKIAYFRQARNEFSENDTPLGLIRAAMPQLAENKLRDILAGFLFEAEDVFRPMTSFSGGQKSRLALALLIAARPNFLLLDEPTNHLDIPSLEALENALDSYDGTLLVVSHDRYFLDGLVDTIYYIEDGRLEIYNGNYSYFESKRAEKNADDEMKAKSTESDTVHARNTIDKKKPRKVNPQIIEKLKSEIAALESEYQEIHEQLIDSNIASDWQTLHNLEKRKSELENLILIGYEKLDSLMKTDSEQS